MAFQAVAITSIEANSERFLPNNFVVSRKKSLSRMATGIPIIGPSSGIAARSPAVAPGPEKKTAAAPAKDPPVTTSGPKDDSQKCSTPSSVRRFQRRLAGSGAHGDLNAALELAPPDARDVLERAAVADRNLQPDVEARTLIGAAARRELHSHARLEDPVAMDEDRTARLAIDSLNDTDRSRAMAAAESLLGWLDRRTGERNSGG